MEKSVLHTRDEEGKHAKRNFETSIKTTVAGLPFRVKSKSDLASVLGTRRSTSYTSPPWNQQVRPITEVFAHTFVSAMDLNIWGQGPLNFPKEDEVDGVEFVLPEGNLLSTALLNAPYIGTNRMEEFYIHDRIRRRNVSKKGRVVSLKMLPGTSTERRDRLLKTAKIRLSTSLVELFPLKQDLPIKKISEELLWLQEVYPDLQIPTRRNTQGNRAPTREDYLRVLCEYRKAYFIEFPEVKRNYELQIEQLDQDDVSSSVQDRTDILQHPYYSLCDEVKELFL
jgi:hypothetical protein